MAHVGKPPPPTGPATITAQSDLRTAQTEAATESRVSVSDSAARWEGTEVRHSQEPAFEPWVERNAPVSRAETQQRNGALLSNLAYCNDTTECSDEHIKKLKADLGLADGTATVTAAVLSTINRHLNAVASVLHKLGYQKVDAGLYSDGFKQVVEDFQGEQALESNGRLTTETARTIEDRALDVLDEEFIAWPPPPSARPSK